MKDFENSLPLNISDEIDNAEIYINEDSKKILISIDYEKEYRLSNSGKTMLISTSGKARGVELLNGDKIYVSFNIYKYPE